MRALVLSLISIATLAAPSVWAENGAKTEPADGGVQSSPRLDVGCAFTTCWRFMAPALAQDAFGTARQPKSILYLGKMVPRGMLVLRRPGDPKETPKELHRTVRSKDRDITSCLQVVGAQYRPSPKALTVWVPADKLPKLKVQYAPGMPAEILFPGAQNCVLLYEIGEGREDEWPEGWWSVSLRFDAGPLNVRLERQDVLSVADPARPEGTAVIYEVKFDAKAARTKTDQENLLYYTYLDRLRSGDLAVRLTAIEPLTGLLEAYPRHGELLHGLAKLQAEAERYADAAATGRKIEKFAREGTLYPWPAAPLGERMTHEETLEYLQRMIGMWEGKAKAQEPKKHK